MRNSPASSLPVLVFASLVAIAMARAENDDVELPTEFANEAHVSLYADYEKARVALEQTMAEELETLNQVFVRSLRSHLLRIGADLEPERVRALKKASKWWVDADGRVSIEGGVPVEFEELVGGYRSAIRRAEVRREEGRRLEFDRLIRKLDALALKFEADGDRDTMRSLRAEARALMPRIGHTMKWGDTEITPYHWSFGEPRFVRMQRDRGAPELVTLARLKGTFAGGGETAKVAVWDEGTSPGLEVHSMQGNVTASAIAIRDKRLELERCHVWTAEIKFGEPRKKLIHSSRGFCYLGGVWGSISDLAICEVALDPADGFYYLSCRMEADSVGARAVVVEYPDGNVPDFSFSTVGWRRGDPARELIDAREGVCVLTGLSGAFKSSVEEIYLFVGADGKWRMGGVSDRINTGAKVLVIRYGD